MASRGRSWARGSMPELVGRLKSCRPAGGVQANHPARLAEAHRVCILPLGLELELLVRSWMVPLLSPSSRKARPSDEVSCRRTSRGVGLPSLYRLTSRTSPDTVALSGELGALRLVAR